MNPLISAMRRRLAQAAMDGTMGAGRGLRSGAAGGAFMGAATGGAIDGFTEGMGLDGEAGGGDGSIAEGAMLGALGGGALGAGMGGLGGAVRGAVRGFNRPPSMGNMGGDASRIIDRLRQLAQSEGPDAAYRAADAAGLDPSYVQRALRQPTSWDNAASVNYAPDGMTVGNLREIAKMRGPQAAMEEARKAGLDPRIVQQALSGLDME